MAELILSTNPGSESRKYALFADDELLISMHFEKEGTSNVVNICTPSEKKQEKLNAHEYKNPLSYFLIWATSNEIINSEAAIETAGLGFVAPGTSFQDNQTLDEAFLDKLLGEQNKAPIHISATLDEAKQLLHHLPHAKLVAVSDSKFHSSIPPSIRNLAIAREDTANLDIHKFGYHGISISSVLRKLESLAGGIHDKVIVCHLGGGASLTAIRNGQSLDTSMGYSPHEGLPMTTRSGDLGIDAALFLMNEKKLSQAQLQSYLNEQSGLRGISGTSGDIRKLLSLYSQSHQGATEALDHYVVAIKERIGSYYALMNGLDMLVFTGTVGLRSAPIRQRVCSNMQALGLFLDESLNESLESDGFINQTGKIGVAVVETDELGEIALQARNF